MIKGNITSRSKIILVYNKEGEFINSYPSMTLAAEACGVKVQNVWKLLKGYKSSLNGYKFIYEADKK